MTKFEESSRLLAVRFRIPMEHLKLALKDSLKESQYQNTLSCRSNSRTRISQMSRCWHAALPMDCLSVWSTDSWQSLFTDKF